MNAVALRPLFAVAGLAVLLSPGGPTPGSEAGGYERVLDASVQRAQLRFEKGRVLHSEHSTWEDPWIVETHHYVVTNTRNYATGLAIADGLEKMLPSFQHVLGTTYVPADPFPIYLFPDLAMYNQFGNDHSDERSSIAGSFYAASHPARPVASMPGVNLAQTKMWITHAAAQQFIDHAFPAAPPTWINEGLGAYFSLYWDNTYGPRELERLVEKNRYIPLQDLVAARVGQYAPNAHDRFMELGMLFTYLLHYRPDTRMAPAGEPESPESFASFLRATLRGEDVEEHPFWDYLVRHIKDLERDFRDCEFTP